MAALTSGQLLKMVDTDFDTAVQDMSTKNLIDTITVLQKEMSREQENFNSLSSELGELKKNSGQYKSISKDLTASQTRLTLLMNRSMKCFNAQGSKKSKDRVEKTSQQSGNRNSDPVKPKPESQIKQQPGNTNSEPVKPKPNSQANNQSSGPAKSNNDSRPVYTQQTSRPSSANRTTIQVQSLKPSDRSTSVNPAEVNGANNDVNNRKSFGEKKDIVSNALPLSQSANSLENGNIKTEISQPVNIVPQANGISRNADVKPVTATPSDIKDKSNTVEVKPSVITVTKPATIGPIAEQKSKFTKPATIGPIAEQKSKFTKPATTGPIAEQKSKFISASADSVTKPKTEVVKSSIKPIKPASKVVLNADKQMIDLDSFTDRRNMLSELKQFDKQLKPVQASSTVTEVATNIGKDDRVASTPTNVEKQNVNGDKAGQKTGLLGDIRLAKKPSEVKVNKTVKEIKQPEATDSQNKLFDDLLKGVDSETDNSESLNDSPREIEMVNDNERKTSEITVNKNYNDLSESEKKVENGVNNEVKPTSEITLAASRDVTLPNAREATPVTEESEDTESETSEASEEDDRFVTEFQFPGNKATKQAASVPPKSPVQKSGKCSFTNIL